MVAKVAADQIIKKWLAPALVGGAAATQSEDADASFASLLAKGANKEGAMAAVGRYYDDFIDPSSSMNPHDINDANESLMGQFLASKEAGNSRQGWFVGADGRPRYEINDAGASVDGRFTRKLQGLLRDKVHAGEDMISQLGLVLNHKPLFNAYPDFEKMPLIFQTDDALGGSAAAYAPASAFPEKMIKKYPSMGRGAMYLNADHMLETDREELIGSLLHESQHAIQDLEGMSAGASSHWSPDDFLSKHMDYVTAPGREAYAKEPLRKADTLYELSEQAGKLDADNAKHLENARPAHQQSLSRFLYKLNAGEAEARAVELRRKRNAAWRKENPPWLDYTEWYTAPRGERSLFDFIESK